MTVWATQTCASTPQTSAWSRPPRSKPSARAAEKAVLGSRAASPSGSRTSATVSPSPRGYCSRDEDRDTERLGAADEDRGARGRVLEPGDGLAEGLLDVDDDEHGAVALRAGRRSSRAPRLGRGGDRERPLAEGDGAGGDRQQDAPLELAPGEAAVLRAALVAVLADDPGGVEVDEAEVGGLVRSRSAGSAARTAPRRSSSARGSGPAAGRRGARARCRAPRTTSPGRSSPSAPARRGPPSRCAHAARGRWRCSRWPRCAAPRSAPAGRPRCAAAGSSSCSCRACGPPRR